MAHLMHTNNLNYTAYVTHYVGFLKLSTGTVRN